MSTTNKASPFGGIRLRLTPSTETNCTSQGIEVPIEDSTSADVVKRIVDDRDSSIEESGILTNSVGRERTNFTAGINSSKFSIAEHKRSGRSKHLKNVSSSESVTSRDKYAFPDEMNSIVDNMTTSSTSTKLAPLREPSHSAISFFDDFSNDDLHSRFSLLSMLNSDISDNEDGSLSESELYQKFTQAFQITLQNNPNILPSVPSFVESVKNILYKTYKFRAENEIQMRMQLQHIMNERVTMEEELSNKMGLLAIKKNELSKELKSAQNERERLENSILKQIDAIQALKQDMEYEINEVSKEELELTKHLGLLGKSRTELETALEAETRLVECKRNSLQTVISQRKAIHKQMLENKDLERRLDFLTEAASKEKAAMETEIEELKSFESHLQILKKKNEERRKVLEKEKTKLMDHFQSIQTKTETLIESKREYENSMEEEMVEVHRQIDNLKVMHAHEKERLIKDKLISYLKHGNDSIDDAHVRKSTSEDDPKSVDNESTAILNVFLNNQFESETHTRHSKDIADSTRDSHNSISPYDITVMHSEKENIFLESTYSKKQYQCESLGEEILIHGNLHKDECLDERILTDDDCEIGSLKQKQSFPRLDRNEDSDAFKEVLTERNPITINESFKGNEQQYFTNLCF